MSKHTPLYESHLDLGGKMVDFAGWQLPLHYGSQLEEHQRVREDLGIFDVSHMGIIDIQGQDAEAFLRYVLANNIDRLKGPGEALYSCLLNEKAGILDDLIVYYLGTHYFRLVVNAARTKDDLAWLNTQAQHFSISIVQRMDLAILAIQGPNSRNKISLLFPPLEEKIHSLKPFQFFSTSALFLTNVNNHVNTVVENNRVPFNQDKKFDSDIFMARTGYTGEDGLEVILPKTKLKTFWDACIAAKIPPIGLGARDTLRLEAGLNLYGQDMDESVSPLESNLARTVALEPIDRDFIGRAALYQQQSQGIDKKLVGLILLEKGVLRHNQKLFNDHINVGVVTSGSFSPTLKKAIALARIHSNIQDDCLVEIRGQLFKVQIVRPPFVRRRNAKIT